MELTIRRENPAEYRAVEDITRAAFWDVNVPGCDEHYLAHILRDAQCFVPELDLVAILDNVLVGNIMYTRAALEDMQGRKHEVLSFGPISVLPEYQGKGVGRALIERSAELARQMGFTAILIYGDPAYYSRLGFLPAEQYGIKGKYGMYSPALQVLELIPDTLKDISGTFIEDDVYELDPEAAAQFDSSFPPREKGFRPSQTRFQEMLAQAHY